MTPESSGFFSASFNPIDFSERIFPSSEPIYPYPAQPLCLISSQFVDLLSVFVKYEDFVPLLSLETAPTQRNLTQRMLSFI